VIFGPKKEGFYFGSQLVFGNLLKRRKTFEVPGFRDYKVKDTENPVIFAGPTQSHDSRENGDGTYILGIGISRDQTPQTLKWFFANLLLRGECRTTVGIFR